MTNYDIAQRYLRIADILELQGENPFKVRAYRTAADTILDLDDDLADLDARGALSTLSGFGPAIVAKTQDFLTSGTTALWDRIKDSVPEGIVAVAGVAGIGPKTARALWDALGDTDIDGVEAACKAAKVRGLAGFGPAKEAALLEKIAAWRRLNARTPRWRALPAAESLRAELRRTPGVSQAELAGDLAMGCDAIAEIQVAVTPIEAIAETVRRIDGMTLRIVAPTPAKAAPPELWDWPDIDDRIAAGTVPTLVTEADFRGQLHEHTTWSDGKASIAQMAQAALERGYSYLAITDHSRSLTIANGLNRDRLLAQIDEVAAVNAQFVPRGLTLLTGIEADILQDGSLDGDDDILARLDIVVGSVHIRYKETEAQMTRRIVAALENPHLDILGHPTGRLLGRREAFAVDIDAVIDAAARHGKILEINAAPERMDLKDEHARKAKAAGVKLTVNADAHSVAGLGLLPWGLCMARRAGLEPADVVNTYSLEALRPCLNR